MESLFESIPFSENPLYENIITDLTSKQYSIIDNFFTSEEVVSLRQSLLQKYEEDAFKKSAIGNRTNEVIKKAIHSCNLTINMYIGEHTGFTCRNLSDKEIKFVTREGVICNMGVV